MFCYIHILLLILVSIICLPTPEPQQQLKFFAKEEFLIKDGKSKSSNLKINSETDTASTYIDSTKVVVYFYKNKTIENHELNVTAKNLPDKRYITSYYVQLPKENKKTLDQISYSCKLVKLSNDKVSDQECKSSFKEEGDKYTFTFNSRLFNSDKLIIKFKYSKVSQTKENIYKTESCLIPSIKEAGKCDYTFIIPKNYKSLGLKYNYLKKETDNEYVYKGDCPDEKLEETFRMSPIKTYWKTDESYFLQSSEPFSRNISFTFLRMYKGGKIRNKDYKLTTNEGIVLNDSELIHDEVYLKTELPGKNNNNVGVNLHTSFTNNLNNDFIVYTSDKYYELNQNIDEVIKAKVDEIINDPNSKYKDYPDYYKLGKFVHNYMEYDTDYTGKNLTVLEIFNEKHGVCEHYTHLYNTMLNQIGIKTVTIIGYGLENVTSANEKTSGHAWTGALIDGKWKEIDVTWDLLEGISSAHLFKGFNEEKYTYNGPTDMKLYKSINLQMIDNLDTEEADYTYVEPQLKYNEEEDKKDNEVIPEPSFGSVADNIDDTDTETFIILPTPKGYAIKLSISIYFYIFYLLFLI